MPESFVDLCGLKIELTRIGRGPPLLLLTGEEALEFGSPVLDRLAAEHELIIPSPPGFGRVCWEPYMHNPKLKRRLHRIKVPTLVIWGENDGITPLAYGRSYAEHIPSATLAVIAQAGHYPHLEQPDAFLKHLRQFLG